MIHLPEDTLNQYLDNALTPGAHAEAEAHLSICQACAAQLVELRALFADLDALPDSPPAIEFAPGILSHLAPGSSLPRPIRWLALAQAIGVIVTVILAWPQAKIFLLSVNLPPAETVFAGLTTFWQQAFTETEISLAVLAVPEVPGDIPMTGLMLAIVGISLLWLLANSLLLLPRFRRMS